MEILEKKFRLAIDTDIGTDCDDAFALVYALQNSNAEILGISTVQERYNYRAKIARKITRILGKDSSIVAGADGDDKWWAGTETKVLSAQERMESLPRNAFPVYDADTKLIGIGPLTNLANQLEVNLTIKNVRDVYLMGSNDESHNFLVDLKAKEKVFSQAWNIYQITKAVSKKIYFHKDELASLRVNAIGNFLADSATNWLEFKKRHSAWMYDVLAVSAALNEGYVKFDKITENRFISVDVDLKLKNSLVEVIKNAR